MFQCSAQCGLTNLQGEIMRLASISTFNRRKWLLAAGAIGLIALAPQAARAGGQSCDNEIDACGCTITTPGIYAVTQSLNSTQGLTLRNDCIDITAAHTILRLQGNSITGPGTGVGTGIWIESSATSSIIEGAGNSGAAPEPPELSFLGGRPGEEVFAIPPPGDDLPVVNLWNPNGAQPTINLWQIGIEVDADYATVELFKQIGGNLFFQHGNSVAGIFVKGASDVTLDDMIVSFNGLAGVNAQDGGNNRFFNLTVDHNGVNGLALQTSNGNTIANLTSDHNKGEGIAFFSSIDNQLFTFGSYENGLEGLFVGTTPVVGGVASTGNHISNGSARQNGEFGVELDNATSGNTVNQLTETGALNKGSYDLVDDNSNCDANVWSNDLVDENRGFPACVGQ
jgi:parallel beta-helix repeat protein